MPSVGKSSYFISHSWSYRFLDLLQVLENFEAKLPLDRPTQFYWFDVFVMNQWSPDEIGSDLRATLQRSIETPGRLLLCLDSWRDPAPLARCWCLFELHTAIKADATILLHMSGEEEDSFTSSLVENSREMEEIIARTRAENADATVAEDKEMIFRFIREEEGFDIFNAVLRDALHAVMKSIVIDHTVDAVRNSHKGGTRATRRKSMTRGSSINKAMTDARQLVLAQTSETPPNVARTLTGASIDDAHRAAAASVPLSSV